jgi:hypothetical protein
VELLVTVVVQLGHHRLVARRPNEKRSCCRYGT